MKNKATLSTTATIANHFFLTIFLLCSSISASAAQESFRDPTDSFIWDMFQKHQGTTLCSVGSISLPAIRAKIANHLKVTHSTDTVTAQEFATALWTLYPCPFSPFRSQLRLATSVDLEGVWIFPESSQKFRFGPKSPQKSPAGPLPVKCDVVGYYPNGELRHGMFSGSEKCPFEKAADLEAARKKPRVSDWSILREGRIGVTRTDVTGHIEEWDVYAVVVPFEVYGVQFKAGDLVAYLRRANGNEVEAATQFRHLQRLP